MKILPHDLGAERELVSDCLLDNSLIDIASDLIVDDDFYSERHRLIWVAIRTLAAKNEPVDLTALRGQLRAVSKLEAVGGDDYLLSLTNTIPTTANVANHARKVAELARRRAMIGTCQDQITKGYDLSIGTDEYLDGAEVDILAVANRCEDPTSCQSIGDVARTVFREVEAASRAGREIQGLPTGITYLDRLLGGLRSGQVFTAAGRPSMGKSAFGAKAAITASKNGHPVFIASLEMSREEWGQRAISMISGIDLSRIRSGKLDGADWKPFGEACDELSTLPIDIDDSANMTILSLRGKCRRARKRRGGLGLIIIDHLQLMRAGGRYDSREREVAEISRSLKGLAKELGVAVLSLAQLNRQSENRKDKRPSLSDLRESGAIEQDSDAVLLLYREEYYDPTPENFGLAEIIVGKQRNGPTGVVRCRFDGPTTRFDNLQRGEYEEPQPKPRNLRAVPTEPHWEKS